jgi:hypothetical protein
MARSDRPTGPTTRFPSPELSEVLGQLSEASLRQNYLLMRSLAARAIQIDPYSCRSSIRRRCGDMLGEDRAALTFYEQALRLLGSKEEDEQIRVFPGAASATEQLYRQNPTSPLRVTLVRASGNSWRCPRRPARRAGASKLKFGRKETLAELSV